MFSPVDLPLVDGPEVIVVPGDAEGELEECRPQGSAAAPGHVRLASPASAHPDPRLGSGIGEKPFVHPGLPSRLRADLEAGDVPELRGNHPGRELAGPFDLRDCRREPRCLEVSDLLPDLRDGLVQSEDHAHRGADAGPVCVGDPGSGGKTSLRGVDEAVGLVFRVPPAGEVRDEFDDRRPSCPRQRPGRRAPPQKLHGERRVQGLEERVEFGEHHVEKALHMALRARALFDQIRTVAREGHEAPGARIGVLARRRLAPEDDTRDRHGVALVGLPASDVARDRGGRDDRIDHVDTVSGLHEKVVEGEPVAARRLHPDSGRLARGDLREYGEQPLRVFSGVLVEGAPAERPARPVDAGDGMPALANVDSDCHHYVHLSGMGPVAPR